MFKEDLGDDILPANVAEDIVKEARVIFNSHYAADVENDKGKIVEQVEKCTEFVANEAKLRQDYLRQLLKSGQFSSQAETDRDVKDENKIDGDELQLVSVKRADPDIPLHGLEDIVWHRKTNGVARVAMKAVTELPKYDAWVPVLHNFYVTEPGVAPYIPYFGSKKRELVNANRCYQLMLVDAKFRSGKTANDELSDGEIHEKNGNVMHPQTTEAWGEFYSLGERRKRASIRHAILRITERCGKTDLVWRSLSFAFEVRNIKRLQYICELAERRNREEAELAERIANTRSHSRKIVRVSRCPTDEPESEHAGDDGAATGALRHFCFPCHNFCCHFHDGENAAPILPIPDHAAQDRSRLLKHSRKSIQACSDTCFLIPAWKQSPVEPEENEPWTTEDRLLLNEAAAMFGWDPCNMAIIVGRTCRDVHERISSPEEKAKITKAWEQSKLPRKVKESDVGDVNSSSSEEVVPPRAKRGTSRKKSGKKQMRGIKSSPHLNVADGEQNIQKRYKPCNHSGPCTKKNDCECAIKDLNCEVYCGCNCGRFREGGKGMYWDPPTDTEIRKGLAILCPLRFNGCGCKSGHCSTDACACFAAMRVCNPDVCESCDCVALPESKKIADRRCRNSSAITSSHKHTFMGESKIHGFGLFAGDYFNEGDLVGMYSGRIMHPDLVEETLRTSQAKGMTYAFDLQDTLTLDAGTVGSKAKFLNHSEGAEQNCYARVERLRGDGIIVLKTAKPVVPGDELLFNYHIIGEGGNDWIMNSGESDDSEESAEEMEVDSPLDSTASNENDADGGDAKQTASSSKDIQFVEVKSDDDGARS
eukprot:GFKZ01007473.1.p1 GENE.GFKZ01007473.1~~GFKZ01007473.1.p1  ORF type:complete len:819 (-),score=105.03 GFKZ01007473.1:298-2754(-)